MGAPRTKIKDIIVDLGRELAGLNKDIDQVNAEIRANEQLPAAREEIEAALRAHIDGRAERYREKMKLELRRYDEVRDGKVRVHDRLDILHLQFAAGVPPLPSDLEILGDGFSWLVQRLGDTAINDLLQGAPSDGISKAEKAGNDAELRAKKRELEMKLEEVCCELERAGFKPDRRPDLSPEVLLEFESKEQWNPAKLERFREGLIEERGLSSRLTEKRQDLSRNRQNLHGEIWRNERNGLEAGNPEITALNQQIAALSKEESALVERQNELNSRVKRSVKLFNACIDFLRAKGIVVYHHL